MDKPTMPRPTAEQISEYKAMQEADYDAYNSSRAVPQCPVILRQLRQVLYATSPPPKESNES